MKKVICITGGSSGFGYEASQALAEKGHIVYAGARSVDKMKPLKAFGVQVLPLNVTQEDSVKAFVDAVIKKKDILTYLLIMQDMALMVSMKHNRYHQFKPCMMLMYLV